MTFTEICDAAWLVLAERAQAEAMCDRNALIVVGAKVDDPEFPTMARALEALDVALCAEPVRVPKDKAEILRAVGVA